MQARDSLDRRTQWRQPWSLLARGHRGDWRVTKSNASRQDGSHFGHEGTRANKIEAAAYPSCSAAPLIVRRDSAAQ